MPLNEALERAMRVYDKEGRHPATADIVAVHLGYKSAENGAAKQALASLRYYGLVERPQEGMLAVTKSVEEYKYSPSEELQGELLLKWLHTPPLYAELLEKYQERLPSDASIKYEFIQKGFSPTSADEYLAAFVGSVSYVKNQIQQPIEGSPVPSEETSISPRAAAPVTTIREGDRAQDNAEEGSGKADSNKVARTVDREADFDTESDRIPVRLAGGRRAWLIIPSPFYSADKRRLIAQLEFLITDDEEGL
jgi:hypothetical protein